MICPILKRLSFELSMLENFYSVFNFPLERVVSSQLHRILDEVDYLEPVQVRLQNRDDTGFTCD